MVNVLKASVALATEGRGGELTPVHVTIALLRHAEGAGNAVLERLGFDRQAALEKLEGLAPRQPAPAANGGTPVFSDAAKRLPASIDNERHDLEMRVAGTEHLLVALVDTSPDVAAVFAAQGITTARLREEIRRTSG